MKATRLMTQAEQKVKRPLKDYLLEGLNGGQMLDGRFVEMAEELEISKSGLGYWMLRLGVQVRGVAVVPGDRVYAIDATGNERLLLEV